jgi:hypothetical protein
LHGRRPRCVLGARSTRECDDYELASRRDSRGVDALAKSMGIFARSTRGVDNPGVRRAGYFRDPRNGSCDDWSRGRKRTRLRASRFNNGEGAYQEEAGSNFRGPPEGVDHWFRLD